MFNSNEAKTRKELIDPLLAKTGWDITNPNQVGLEIPADDYDPAAWHTLQAKLKKIREDNKIPDVPLPSGICDYVLYRSNGEILAVVEAKRTSTDPRLAQAQAEFYISEIEKRQSFRPFAFMTNGYDIYFLDAGETNKRQVAGFFTKEDLESRLFLRQNKQPFDSIPINTTITNRLYQQEAIRRVCEDFKQNKRRALLVMATGTGKTRTTMSLVDIFLRTNQARKILFVADRDELVKQALEAFKKYLPDEPCTRIYTQHINTTSRLYVSTLQTLNTCFSSFSPGFFDLIVFDEVHRSIFNKWSEVLQYFDARFIGLTATPAGFIDRNTFLSFERLDGTPTFLYPYDQAIKEGYLVNYSLYLAKTKFQRNGIKGVDLSEEERNSLIELGIDPDELDYSGSDLEKKVSNKDTLRKQWEEILEVCYKDQSGQLPGKTIVFAMTQDHAMRLLETFEEMNPQWPGLARVITYQSDYKSQLIDKFKKEDYPRIAISVDLLDTGVDVPEVVNLAFMKPVQSRIKLEQMIGRGTRPNEACNYPDRLPDGIKKGFLIMDFWENDFNKPAEEEISQSLPVQQTIFNTRLKQLERYLAITPNSPEVEQVITNLREQVSTIPTNSFSVKKVLPDVQAAWQDNFWLHLNKNRLDFLRNKLAPLLRFASSGDVQAATFISKVERLKFQLLTGANAAATCESIADDASRLPDFVMDDPKVTEMVHLCANPNQLQSATQQQLNQASSLLAPQMKNRREQVNSFISLDLPDYVEMHGYIWIKGGSQPVYVEDYKERVNKRILELIDNNPVIETIGKGQPVKDEQLLELERIMRQKLGNDDLELNEDNIRKAYGQKVGSLLEFLRWILDLPAIPDYSDIVRRRFEDFMATQPFNSNQINFMRSLESVFLQKRRLKLPDLYQAPLTQFGMNAVDRWFSLEQIDAILNLTKSLSVVGG